VNHACDPSAQEAEAEGSGPSALHTKALSQNKTKNKTNKQKGLGV
jgi:hypothetical protein